MALYVALCYYDRDQPWDGVPDKESTPEYTEFARRATEAGVMRGGEALHPVTMSTTITVSGGKGGDVLVTDGPYAEAFVADYTDDASVVQPGVYKKDREEIRATMAAGFAGPLNGSRVAARPVDVRFLTGDTAIVVSEDGIIFPGQDAVASERLVRATWVLVRRDGGWRIASYHNSPAS